MRKCYSQELGNIRRRLLCTSAASPYSEDFSLNLDAAKP